MKLNNLLVSERFLFRSHKIAEPSSKQGTSLKTIRSNFIEEAGSDCDVILFYFAGHGLRLDTNTYLVPGYAKIGVVVEDFLDECIEVNSLVRLFRKKFPTSKRIFIFDCCRNSGKRELEKISGDSLEDIVGVEIEPDDNELICFSTSLDGIAREKSDEKEKKFGIFTEALLERLENDDEEASLVNHIQGIEREFRDSNASSNQRPDLKWGRNLEDFSLSSVGSFYENSSPGFEYVNFNSNITDLDVSPSGINTTVVSTGKEYNKGEIHLLSKRRPGNRKKTSHKIETKTFDAKPYCVQYSPDGKKFYAGFSDGKLCEFSNTGDLLRSSSDLGTSPLNCIRFASRFNCLLAAFSDGLVRVISLEGLELIAIAKHWSSVWSLDVHRSDHYFVTGSKDGHLRLFKLLYGLPNSERIVEHSLMMEPLGLATSVRALSFDRSGEFLAVGDYSGNIKIFNFDEKQQTLQERAAFRVNVENGEGLNSLSFSPDSKILAVGMSKNGYQLWRLEDPILVSNIESLVTNKDHCWDRSNVVKFDPASRRLYASAGRKLHVIKYNQH